MTEIVVALTTLPENFDAAGLAQTLVTSGVAACVSILPGVESVYVWEGKTERSREQQLVIKTTSRQVPALWEALRARHPYDVPEFLVLPVIDGHKAYLDWIKGRTRDPRT